MKTRRGGMGLYSAQHKSAAHAHRASRGTGKAKRTAKQSHGMARALSRLRQDFADRCVRGR